MIEITVTDRSDDVWQWLRDHGFKVLDRREMDFAQRSITRPGVVSWKMYRELKAGRSVGWRYWVVWWFHDSDSQMAALFKLTFGGV